MASLDKAFIKAYQQQGTAADSIPLDTSGTESLVEALEDRPLREAKKQSVVARHQGVLAALQTERSPAWPQPAPARPAESSQEDSVQDGAETNPAETRDGLQACNEDVPGFLRPSKKMDCPRPGSRTAPRLGDDTRLTLGSRKDVRRLDLADAESAIPKPHIAAGAMETPDSEGPAAAGAGTLPDTAGAEPQCVDPPGTAPRSTSPGAELEIADALPIQGERSEARPSNRAGGKNAKPRTFYPLLQVERMTPSPIGERLQQRVSAELDRLADALMAVAERGRKVIGFASDQPGQGVTTVLGAVALRLAERRRSIAAVDANLTHPQLASEAGLLPEYGWEKALETPMPLEELVIESVEQPIGLMPLCREFDAAHFPDDFTFFRDALATFREYYDLVLVDVGVPCDALIGRMLRTLDTVLLVFDARRTQTECLTDLHRALNRAGVNVAGMIESFDRGE